MNKTLQNMQHEEVKQEGEISKFAICHILRHGNVNSIQNPSTVTNRKLTINTLITV